MAGVLHTARINAIEFIVSGDKWTLLSKSSRNSVDRAPARCSGGHGFDSCRNQIVSLSHARVMLFSSLFTILLLLFLSKCYQVNTTT